jgi:hypothetical protein
VASADAARRTMLEEMDEAAEALDSGNRGFWDPILDILFGRGGIPEKKVDNAAAVSDDFIPTRI